MIFSRVEQTQDGVFLPEDSATKELREVWVSRHGNVYNDERLARWDGSTHRQCPSCNRLTKKNSYCRPCHQQAQIEKWEKANRVPWPDHGVVYSLSTVDHWDDREDWLEDCLESIRDPREDMLYACCPVYARRLDMDDWSDDLPPDEPWNDDLNDLINNFNERLEGIGPLSYRIGDEAVIIELDDKEVEQFRALFQNNGKEWK